MSRGGDDDIRIDPEFQGLIPPLRPDERERLETSIRAEGIRDAIIVWRQERVVLDGHNRIEIAKRLNIPYRGRIQLRDFDSRADAMRWILENQLGRRNLSDLDRIAIASKLEEVIGTKAKANQRAAGGALPVKSPEPIDTRQECAKLAGVGPQKYTEGKRVLAEGSPELIEAVRSGEISVHRAATIVDGSKTEIYGALELAPVSEIAEEPKSDGVASDGEIQALRLSTQETFKAFREKWRAYRRAALTRCRTAGAHAVAGQIEREIVDPTKVISRSAMIAASALRLGRAPR